MYELLLSADYLVPDADTMARTIVTGLGLPEPRPSWRQAFAGHPFVANWLRINPSLAIAPTRIETISYSHLQGPGDPSFADYLDSLVAFQGRHRPVKTHATVVVTADLASLMESLMRRRVPFRLAPHSEQMAFDRIWTGVSAEDVRYRPDWDGGLMIEVLPLEALQLPDDVIAASPPPPRALREGELLRVSGRAHLVRDLDHTLRVVSALGLEPAVPVTCSPHGYRLARVAFRAANSATLDLIEPIDPDCNIGRYLATWGPGPHYTRIAVHGLDAALEELRRRGTGFDRMQEMEPGRAGAALHPTDMRGAIIELVESDG